MPFRPLSLVCLCALSVAGLPGGAAAQPPAAGTTAATAPVTVPADVQKTIDTIGDLDVLKALVPLKLTADQIKKLVTVMKEVVAANETRRKEEIAGWRSIAEDVAKAREDALNGVNIAPEVETRILKVVADSDKRSITGRQEGINLIYAVAREILTPEQKDLIEQQVVKILGGKKLVPAQYRNNPSRAPKEEVQNLMLQVFIERILMYDRSLALLGKLKPSDPPAEPAPPPPPPPPGNR